MDNSIFINVRPVLILTVSDRIMKPRKSDFGERCIALDNIRKNLCRTTLEVYSSSDELKHFLNILFNLITNTDFKQIL